MAESTRTCPTCSGALQSIQHEGVSLDSCPAGHGLWLDRGELHAVVMSEVASQTTQQQDAALAVAGSDAGHAVVAEAGRAARACPVCGTRMRLTEYAGSGIPIDECHEHGAWLDDGELGRIEAYAEGVRRTGTGGTSTTVAGITLPASLLASLQGVRGATPPPS